MNQAVPNSTKRKWIELTDLIISLTRNDKLTWQESTFEKTVSAGYRGSVLSLMHSPSSKSPGNTMYLVIISDANGKTVEEFSDEDLDEFRNDHEHGYYHKLKDLFLEINRKISGAEQLLDELIKGMKDEDEMPF